MRNRWLPQAIAERWRKAASEHHQIAHGMAWIAAFVFLGKLAAAAKEMMIAWRFGVSAEVDAYLFVFNLVNWPIAVWFSVLTVVLVPLAARIRHGAPTELPRFRSELLGLTLLLGLALAFLGWLGLPWLLRSRWTGLPEATVNLAISMVPTLALLTPLGLVISLFSSWMMAAGRQANTLLESVPALTILVALLALPGDGVEALVWGTLAGFAFHLASLAVPQARQREIETPRFTRQSPHWPAFWQGFGIMLAGQALMSLTTIIDQFFAARMDAGAIATLSYANRILALIMGMGAMAVSRATLPVFARAQATQGNDQVHRLATHWVRLLFVLGVVTMLIGWWLAPWGVKLLFERGEFTPQDTIAVVEVLRYGLTQLPFYFSSIVLVSLLASQENYRLIAIIASSNLLMKIILTTIFIPVLDIKAIPLGTSAMYTMTLILFMLKIQKNRTQLE